ncbi:MAG: site-2 protease family protein [Candidatus Altiarchaeota archaeon]|nr:site-2 protease family protein [Candidatus Altiarchaeota archaeon]
MRSSYRIFRVFGISVELHITFILLLVLLLGYGWLSDGLVSGIKLVVLFIVLFAVVLFHELAHSSVALLWGVNVPRITLLPIGGAAHVEIPEKPHMELIMAVAGPLFNVVFAFFCLVFLVLVFPVSELFPPWDILEMAEVIFTLEGLLKFLLHINVVLAVFNLLPIFPMDGGRVFRAILALFMDYTRATTIAANVGQYLSLLLVFGGVLSLNPLILLIGVLIYMAAGQELKVVKLRHALAGLSMADAAIKDYAFVSESMSLRDFMDYAVQPQVYYYPVVDGSGSVVGMFSPEYMSKTSPADLESATVGGFMVRDYLTVKAGDSVSEKIIRILERDFVFVEGDGGIIGYLTPGYLSDLASYRKMKGF